MVTIYEFRINEQYADRLLPPLEGVKMGSVRKVELSDSDPRLLSVGRLQKECRELYGKPFFFGWTVRRMYSEEELNKCDLIHLKITKVFEPTGEECGTIYDRSEACPYCGAGRKQVSPLFLDLKAIPKNRDIAKTIGGEIIVSEDLARLISSGLLKGARVVPVAQKRSSESVRSNWFQLHLVSSRVATISPTRFGIDPFDNDTRGEYRCPSGHVNGLNLLSELFLSRSDWDGSDFIYTKDLTGVSRGLLVPEPALLISSKALGLFRANRIRGFELEAAHLGAQGIKPGEAQLMSVHNK